MGNVRLLFGFVRGAFGAAVPAVSIDLSMAKADSPDPVDTGDPLVYTLTVTNLNATETANNVQVVDTLPAGVTFVSAVGTGWVCLEAAGTVTCDRATAGPGAAPDITITVTAPGSAGPITNTAVVSADEFDPNLANNTAMETTTVQVPSITPATGIVNYSIGIAAGNIGTGGTVTFASGQANFSLAQTNAVGIGDEIDYGAGLKAFISQRVSSTVMAVTDAVGDFPPDVVGAAINGITRSFASITAANAGSLDASHLNTADLTTAGTAGVILQWPCWDDGDLDDDEIVLDAYTTGASNYLRIYAPFDQATEVAVSQRHTGVAGTGFRMQPTGVPTSSNSLRFFEVDTPTQHVRFEGLEIDGSAKTMVRQIFTFDLGNSAGLPNATSDIRFDGCLIYNMVNDGTVAGGDGRMRHIFIRDGNCKVSNCFIYGAVQDNSNSGSDILGIRVNSGTGTIAIFNCTIFDFSNGAGSATIRGFSQTGSQTSVQCRNCVGMKLVGSGGLTAFNGTWDVATNNVASDTTATNIATAAPNADSQTTFASYFVNATAGTQDLHLLDTAMNLWGLDGVDLSADATLPVTEDIDLVTRVAPFDIGGDQF